jgi:FOG: TPR repeat
MPSSARSILLGALSLFVLCAGTATAEQSRHMANIGLVGKPWAVAVKITGYRILIDGVKPDGRRYFFATNASTSMTLSVTLEMVSGEATGQGCLTHLENIAQQSSAHINRNVMHDEIQQMPVIEYVIPEMHGQREGPLHLFACAGKENVYADIHISKTGFKTGDESLLRDMLNSLHIVSADTADSLDHFQAGSAPYLQGKYSQAIPHYEQALALERSNPRLDKSLWRLLIDNLGMAFGMTGDIPRAKSTFEYGLSQDPANSMFHYNLARMHAGMNDREKAMQSLHRAFQNSLPRKAGESLPDPRQDRFFARCMLDPVFRTFAESLMQPAV